MTPEESVQAHLDLHGRRLMPIHNGTFDLALHSWTEPFERVISHTKVTNAAVLTPRFGERVDIRAPAESTSWWR
jgi:L-ascorbate metabolism protein UlaG (beta-lactamase superfamily)